MSRVEEEQDETVEDSNFENKLIVESFTAPREESEERQSFYLIPEAKSKEIMNILQGSTESIEPIEKRELGT